MPLYLYGCRRCGAFELFRPVADAAAPAPCPACGGAARRRFTPPGLALLDAPLRTARDAEERSAHEPAVVGRKQGRPMPHRHGPAPPWALGH